MNVIDHKVLARRYADHLKRNERKKVQLYPVQDLPGAIVDEIRHAVFCGLLEVDEPDLEWPTYRILDWRGKLRFLQDRVEEQGYIIEEVYRGN